jgi:hypothetical protein
MSGLAVRKRILDEGIRFLVGPCPNSSICRLRSRLITGAIALRQRLRDSWRRYHRRGTRCEPDGRPVYPAVPENPIDSIGFNENAEMAQVSVETCQNRRKTEVPSLRSEEKLLNIDANPANNVGRRCVYRHGRRSAHRARIGPRRHVEDLPQANDSFFDGFDDCKRWTSRGLRRQGRTSGRSQRTLEARTTRAFGEDPSYDRYESLSDALTLVMNVCIVKIPREVTISRFKHRQSSVVWGQPWFESAGGIQFAARARAANRNRSRADPALRHSSWNCRAAGFV